MLKIYFIKVCNRDDKAIVQIVTDIFGRQKQSNFQIQTRRLSVKIASRQLFHSAATTRTQCYQTLFVYVQGAGLGHETTSISLRRGGGLRGIHKFGGPILAWLLEYLAPPPLPIIICISKVLHTIILLIIIKSIRGPYTHLPNRGRNQTHLSDHQRINKQQHFLR